MSAAARGYLAHSVALPVCGPKRAADAKVSDFSCRFPIRAAPDGELLA